MTIHVFPQPEKGMAGNAIEGTQRGGLTARELFAAMAMQGYAANPSDEATPANKDPRVWHAVIAYWSVQAADALIAELAKGPNS